MCHLGMVEAVIMQTNPELMKIYQVYKLGVKVL